MSTGTYSDVLKRHIRAKLDTSNNPNETERPQRGGQQTNQMENNEPEDDRPRFKQYSRVPRWRGRSWNNRDQYHRRQGYRQQEQEEGYRQRRQPTTYNKKIGRNNPRT